MTQELPEEVEMGNKEHGNAFYVPDSPDLPTDGPTLEEGKKAAKIAHKDQPDAADLPTNVRDGEAGGGAE